MAGCDVCERCKEDVEASVQSSSAPEHGDNTLCGLCGGDRGESQAADHPNGDDCAVVEHDVTDLADTAVNQTPAESSSALTQSNGVALENVARDQVEHGELPTQPGSHNELKPNARLPYHSSQKTRRATERLQMQQRGVLGIKKKASALSDLRAERLKELYGFVDGGGNPQNRLTKNERRGMFAARPSRKVQTRVSHDNEQLADEANQSVAFSSPSNRNSSTPTTPPPVFRYPNAVPAEEGQLLGAESASPTLKRKNRVDGEAPAKRVRRWLPSTQSKEETLAETAKRAATRDSISLAGRKLKPPQRPSVEKRRVQLWPPSSQSSEKKLVKTSKPASMRNPFSRGGRKLTATQLRTADERRLFRDSNIRTEGSIWDVVESEDEE